jgi:hypothetical protein
MSALQVIAPAPATTLAALHPGGSSTSGTSRKLRTQQSAGTHGGSAIADPDHELVLEGLGRLVSALPPDAMGAAGLGLTQPFVARAQAFAQAGRLHM